MLATIRRLVGLRHLILLQHVLTTKRLQQITLQYHQTGWMIRMGILTWTLLVTQTEENSKILAAALCAQR